jgi:hypothetical protein
LEVGYREKSKPFCSNNFDDPHQRMKSGYQRAWLDQLEAMYKGFEKDHTTYYGYSSEENDQLNVISTENDT